MKLLPSTKLALALLTVAVISAAVAGCVPERPAKDGPGPLAVTIDREFSTPATHSPLGWWQAYHPEVINAGDIAEKDCLYCHQVERSCNNCHAYVGARQIAPGR